MTFRPQTAEEMAEITKSQEFVSKKYDELLAQTRIMKETFDNNLNTQKTMDKKLTNVEKKVDTNIKTSRHNAKYTRRDCTILEGVKKTLNANGKEDCKKLVMDIFKELHLIIDENLISTAHRLHKHASKSGPPGIIVKFVSRDARNSVYALKEAAREKVSWRCCEIERLYINECLTPETKRLLYNTKIFKREMKRIHGDIFVWTYKGDVFVRKDGENNPRIKIISEDDLNKVRSGEINMDAAEITDDVGQRFDLEAVSSVNNEVLSSDV